MKTAFLPSPIFFTAFLLFSCGEGYWTPIDPPPEAIEQHSVLEIPLDRPSFQPSFAPNSNPAPSTAHQEPPAEEETPHEEDSFEQAAAPEETLPASEPSYDTRLDSAPKPDFHSSSALESSNPNIKGFCWDGWTEKEKKIFTEISFLLYQPGQSPGNLCELDASYTAKQPDWMAKNDPTYCWDRMRERIKDFTEWQWKCRIQIDNKICVYQFEQEELVCDPRDEPANEPYNESAGQQTGLSFFSSE